MPPKLSDTEVDLQSGFPPSEGEGDGGATGRGQVPSVEWSPMRTKVKLLSGRIRAACSGRTIASASFQPAFFSRACFSISARSRSPSWLFMSPKLWWSRWIRSAWARVSGTVNCSPLREKTTDPLPSYLAL